MAGVGVAAGSGVGPVQFDAAGVFELSSDVPPRKQVGKDRHIALCGGSLRFRGAGVPSSRKSQVIAPQTLLTTNPGRQGQNEYVVFQFL